MLQRETPLPVGLRYVADHSRDHSREERIARATLRGFVWGAAMGGATGAALTLLYIGELIWHRSQPLEGLGLSAVAFVCVIAMAAFLGCVYAATGAILAGIYVRLIFPESRLGD
jgi:Mg/Co/Ni transporter MgtE